MEASSNVFKPNSKPQNQALKSTLTHPITLFATGIQVGKTTIIAMATKIAMHTYTDKLDNFIITAPTYKILSQSTLPPFLRMMEGCGTYHKQDAVFEMDGGGLCYFRTATDPDSIVGITNVRFIGADEAGLYSLYFWENIQARAAFKNARVILGTSPYTLNWVYKDLIRPKTKSRDARPDVNYVKARSIDNPLFSREYYERMRETMDERRFRAMFGGEWEKMDGLVYDCFDETENSITPYELPEGTKYYAGVDFGFTAPFAVVIIAITPERDYFQITEIYKTGLTVLDMVQLVKQKMQYYPISMVYADPSSPGSIEEFNRAGIPTAAADNEIRRGIDFVYELIKSKKYKLFRGDNKFTIDELETYHYPSEDEIKVNTNIEDELPVKQSDHACDALRYVVSATYAGRHRKLPQVISTLDTKEKMNIYQRAKAIYEPKQEKFEEY